MQCQIYKTIQKQSMRRKSIKYDTYPEVIMELFPNPETDPTGLVDLIRDLPADLGTVVTLKIYQDLSITEISSQMKISPRTVSYRWMTALKILREKMQ
jgi:DNA-directed RNA polymerase specialized sigma24 family protein